MALALAAAVLLPNTPQAQGDFPSGLKTIAGVSLEGRRHVPARDLWAVLKTRRPSIFPWRERPVVRLDFLEADVRGLEQVARSHGYLDARASYRLEPTSDERAVRVVFTLEEGPRSHVRSVEFSGVQALSPDQLRRRLYTRPGRPFNPSALVLDTARVSAQYKERGMLPHVIAEARRDSLDVAVVFEVDEGPVYRNAETFVTVGAPGAVNERLVRRELLMKPGDTYRASRVQRSVERLYETGLFSQVQIATLPDTATPQVDYDVRVRGRRPRWIDAGVGSGTSERFRFTGEWGHRNLTGGGMQGALSARLAFDGKARFLLSRAEISALEPWLLRTRTRGVVSVYVESRREYPDTGRVTRRRQRPIGVRFQLRRELGRWARVALTQENIFMTQDVEIPDPVAAALDSTPRRYTTRRLLAGLDRDTRDDPLNPVRGSVQSAVHEYAGGFLGGTTSFTKGQISSSWYTPLPRGWVLAARLAGGAIDLFGPGRSFSGDSIDAEVARVPIEDRFRIGGVNSLRGYDENELPGAGGLAMVQGNLELRIPVVGPFGIEAFIDAGNVWPRVGYMKAKHFVPRAGRRRLDPGDVRYHFGLGARLQLPFGPLRVDFTWSPRPDELGRWRVAEPQFAIGPSF